MITDKQAEVLKLMRDKSASIYYETGFIQLFDPNEGNKEIFESDFFSLHARDVIEKGGSSYIITDKGRKALAEWEAKHDRR